MFHHLRWWSGGGGLMAARGVPIVPSGRHPSAPPQRRPIMAWKTPKIVEVSLALEINSYACAEVG